MVQQWGVESSLPIGVESSFPRVVEFSLPIGKLKSTRFFCYTFGWLFEAASGTKGDLLGVLRGTSQNQLNGVFVVICREG